MATKKSGKAVRNAAKVVRKASKKQGGLIVLAVLILLALAVVAVLYFTGHLNIPGLPSAGTGRKETTRDVNSGEKDSTPPSWESETPKAVVAYDSEDLVITFLELGNWYTGDCTFIKAGDTDILIDAGSRLNSVPFIQSVIDTYCTDGSLEYVIVTHAHQDHIAGFSPSENSSQPGIFDLYECKTIIDFALTNATSQVYSNYQRELADEVKAGARHMTAAEVRQSGIYRFVLSEGITMTILDSKFYYEKSSDENNYSVCCLINQGGDRNFLFTGDLEKEGEAALVELNDLPRVNLFKGGHHGSYTANTDALLSVVQPDIVCICCCAFSNEYTKTPENMFPAQVTVDRIAKYTDRVYVTSVSLDNENKTFGPLNGTITVRSQNGKDIVVSCTGEAVPLKDTEWFRKNRNMPEAWAEAS